MSLEDQIKRKLENRTIEPSDQAWAKLQKQLLVNSNRKYGSILKIVAVLLGILGLFFVFNPRTDSSDVIVEKAPESTPQKEKTLIAPEVSKDIIESKLNQSSLLEKTDFQTDKNVQDLYERDSMLENSILPTGAQDREAVASELNLEVESLLTAAKKLIIALLIDKFPQLPLRKVSAGNTIYKEFRKFLLDPSFNNLISKTFSVFLK